MLISLSQSFGCISVLMVIAGTYLITKVTFVDFMITEYKRLWEERNKPNWLFSFACKAYFIDSKDLETSDAVAPDSSKFRKAISFQDPFRGFLWVSLGALIQICLILFGH